MSDVVIESIYGFLYGAAFGLGVIAVAMVFGYLIEKIIRKF